jgi:hypothetical protein
MPESRSGGEGWGAWVRAHPGLALAILGYGLVAIVGLVISLPRFTPPALSTGSAPGPSATARPSAAPTPRGEVAPARPETQSVPGPWVEAGPGAASASGLALVYRYRVLPPGGESRYEWVVQLRGAPSTLAGIDTVTWRMDPPPKNGADLVSRERAHDGFPLFGHGPGGWFGLSADVRFKDGAVDTLRGRIEFPE